jgi:RimJ/RimL family protein N-acetyltransferase
VGFTKANLPIHTERLTLRALQKSDADSVYAMYSNPDMVRYLYIEQMQPGAIGDAMKRRLKRNKLESEGDVLELAVELTATGEFVGALTFMYPSGKHRRGEIGYAILPEYAGRGYATEGGRALLSIGFDVLGLHRIEAQCDARNVASARVMARLGMQPEAHLRQNEFVKGEWTDEILYGMLAEDWAQLNKA